MKKLTGKKIWINSHEDVGTTIHKRTMQSIKASEFEEDPIVLIYSPSIFEVCISKAPQILKIGGYFVRKIQPVYK